MMRMKSQRDVDDDENFVIISYSICNIEKFKFKISTLIN